MFSAHKLKSVIIEPSAGGVLIRSADGAIMGAIGVSGDTPDVDAACAQAGVTAFHGDR